MAKNIGITNFFEKKEQIKRRKLYLSNPYIFPKL